MQTLTENSINSALKSQRAADYLEERCVYIGRGGYNKVYHHPLYANRVIKINSEMDDGTLMFCKYCQENPSLFLPKISNTYKTLWHEIVIQELLSPIYNINDSKIVECVGAMTKGIWDYQFVNEFRTFSGFLTRFKIYNKTGVHLNDHQIAFLRTCYETISHFSPYYSIDINCSNVMVRGSALVLVDPLANEYNDYLEA